MRRCSISCTFSLFITNKFNVFTSVKIIRQVHNNIKNIIMILNFAKNKTQQIKFLKHSFLLFKINIKKL